MARLNVVSLTMFIIVAVFQKGKCDVHYLKPMETQSCGMIQECPTLSEFAVTSVNDVNTTLILLPGNHVLDTHMSFSNLTDLSMYSEDTATVTCDPPARFSFEAIDRLYIRNVKFIGCGDNLVKYVDDFILQEATFQGKDNSGTSLTLINTTADIVSCSFVGNQFGTVMDGVRSLISLTTEVNWFLVGDVTGIIRIGGALISSFSNVSISHSNFENNKAEVGGDIFTEDFSSISIFNSTFSGEGLLTSESEPPFAGSIFSHEGNFTIQDSRFLGKNATVGGGIVCTVSTFRINGSQFISNSASDHGGAFFAYNSRVFFNRCNFERNFAGAGAGYANQEGYTEVDASTFIDNVAVRHAAALDFYQDYPTVRGCIFINNVAHSFAGAVLFWFSDGHMYGNIAAEGEEGTCNSLEDNCFNHTTKISYDPAILDSFYRTTDNFLGDTTLFLSNSAPTGAAIYVIRSTVNSCGPFLFANNYANLYSVVYFLDSNGTFNGSTEMSKNLGSFFAFNSKISFSGCSRFVECSPPKTTETNFDEGGALTSIQSILTLNGESVFERNHAEVGGAIIATESIVNLNDRVIIANNIASKSGGGIYLSQTDFFGLRESTVTISNNIAANRGGGIYAVSSSIKCYVSGAKVNQSEMKNEYTGALVTFLENTAQQGGAIFLEANSKITLLKDYIFETPLNFSALNFIGNRAEYGGAITIDDASNSGTCASNPHDRNAPQSECFIRVIATHTILTANTNYSLNNIFFDSNFATVSGTILFGGLLDRCSVSPFNEVDRTIDITVNEFLVYTGDALQYLYDISTGNSMESISSYPLQLCPCIDGLQNCSKKVWDTVKIRSGNTLTMSLIAVDQVYRPVNATIQGYLYSTESDLTRGQVTSISDTCTDISFQIISSHETERLTLYASNGPCNDAELSTLKVNITIEPCTCPIGFERSRIRSSFCSCTCHSDLSPYVTECRSRALTFKKTPSDVNVWISYHNSTKPGFSGYLVHKYCPFDYCSRNASMTLNLSAENGADTQCAFNRRGLLCGACKPGFSLSLGSSKCLKCPYYWPAMLIAITLFAFLAGLALVALIMSLNMTVAVGTLNGLLFYANIVSANRVVLLPTYGPLSVFISWLNLELGIDVCFIEGLDTYGKTWLQLAFPIYIILLVILLIICSQYSTRFSKLIAKRDPVATLATLILLSYGKLFDVVLLAQPFSFATLSYPGNVSKILWLPDGTVEYLHGKHIVMFIVAVIIVIICIGYGVLLLCWQLILRLPNWKIFKIFRKPSLSLFMVAYHIPYTPRHRYWTGMLLLARAVLYLIAAENVSGDPQIQLLAIIHVLSCIIFLKMFIATRIFKNRLIDVIDSLFYVNIIFFASFTSYNLSTGNSQDTAAFISVSLTILITIFIVFYHVYKYTSLFKVMFESKIGKSLKSKLEAKYTPKRNIEIPRPSITDDSIRRFDDIFDLTDYSTNETDYHSANSTESFSRVRKPNTSVVEIGE